MPKTEIKFKGTIIFIHSDAKKEGIERTMKIDTNPTQRELIKQLDHPTFLGREVFITVCSPQMEIAFGKEKKKTDKKKGVKKTETKRKIKVIKVKGKKETAPKKK